MKPSFPSLTLAAMLAAVSPLAAQDQNSEVIQVSPDMFLRWYGHSGRTYFVQISDPNDHLRNWIWAPIIESGDDEDISYEVDGTADKGFFRLWFTDEPTVDPDGDDFDGDGLSNLSEVLTHQTNPLKSDTDGDGLLDGWEIANSLDPNDDGSTNVNNGGSGDPDNDGLTNSEEQDLGADPNDADSDDDGITDGGENDQGTDPNDSEDTPDAEWFILTGDLDQDEVKTRKRTVTIPAGQSRVIAVVVASDEYPDWTGDESEFNDTLEWDIQPSEGAPLQGSIDVNARHGEWEEAELDGRECQGFTPAHVETGMTLTAPDDAALTVEIELSATNIGDGAKPSTVMVALLPVELLTDIDNNGEIGGADSGLAQKAFESGATEEDVDKGTEFLFANDQLSNGLWDGEDSDPDKPAAEKDDDDAQQIKIDPGITEGEVWLEHPAIAGLSFYKTRECKAGDKIDLSTSSKFTISEQNPFPEEIFIRADGNIAFPAADPQVAGDLVLKIKVGDQEIEATKIKLTVVKELGAKKYFHAARDYILENNTKLYVDDRGFPASSPTSTIRICSMLEEQTKMNPFESYHDDARENWIQNGMLAGAPFEPDKFTSFGLGISGAMASDPESTVVINGNQCDFTDPSLPNPLDPLGEQQRLATLTALSLAGEAHLTDRCHGRLHAMPPGWPVSRKNDSSSDHDDPNTLVAGTHFRGSYLAGDDPVAGTALAGGKYFTQYSDGTFEMGAGRVPDPGFGNAIHGAIGGLSGNYSSGDRNNYPNSFLGHHPMDEHGESGKGVVFVAMGKGGAGNGKVVEFYEAAKVSGVPEIPGATPDSAGKKIIKLLMLDSGNTSCALAHKNPSNDFIKVYEGDKHRGFPYYTNTFLRFKSSKPRDDQ